MAAGLSYWRKTANLASKSSCPAAPAAASTHATDNRGIVEAYGSAGRFLHSALAALSVDDTLAMFQAEGVATKIEETGKVFPVSNKASDVLEALRRRLDRSGATLTLAEPITNLQRADQGFALTPPQRLLTAERLILTPGGQSYPGSGTTGDGFQFAAQHGHTIVPPLPRPCAAHSRTKLGRGTSRHHHSRRRCPHPRRRQAPGRPTRLPAFRPLWPFGPCDPGCQPRRQRPPSRGN